MKFKKILVYFLIYFSFVFVFLPFIFGGVQNFERIFHVLSYEEKVKDLNFKDKDVFTEKFRQDFLNKTDDVFSTIELKGKGKFPVFLNREDFKLKRQNFFGEWLNDSFFVFLKRDDGFENFFERFKDVEKKDLIILNFFGICKKFVVKEVKLVANSNLIEKFSDGVLTILLDLPCTFNSFKFLIRADFLENIPFEKSDFFSLCFKDLYFFIFFVVLIFLFFLINIILAVKIINLLKKRKKLVKIKYVKGALYFEKCL